MTLLYAKIVGTLSPPHGVSVRLANLSKRRMCVSFPTVGLSNPGISVTRPTGELVGPSRVPCFGQVPEKIEIASHSERSCDVDLAPFYFGMSAIVDVRLRFAWTTGTDEGEASTMERVRLDIPDPGALVREFEER